MYISPLCTSIQKIVSWNLYHFHTILFYVQYYLWQSLVCNQGTTMAGCVCNTMNKGLLFVCVVAVLWSASAGQGTYHRSCDCDYTKDGRCIYSLAIPTCSGCSDNMCSAGDSLAEVQTTLNQLANNLTQQALYSGDQARMLNTLQNMLLEQQTTLQQLRMESGNNDNDNSCAQCESLQNQIESQQTVIENLQESISAFQSSMSDVSSQILSITETVSQGTQIDEFIEALQEQQTEFSNSIDNLVNMMHGSAAGYWMCHQKSLLVSGALANISDTAITASSMAEDAAKVRIRPYMVLDAALMPGWCPGKLNCLIN